VLLLTCLFFRLLLISSGEDEEKKKRDKGENEKEGFTQPILFKGSFSCLLAQQNVRMD